MKSLDPTYGLPNRREVWAWGIYDIANQSFTLMVNTLLFSVFFVEIVVGDQKRGDALWGYTAGGSMLLVVLASPFIGAVCDCLSIKKKLLIAAGLVCSVATAALVFLRPDTIWLAVLLYVPANFAYQIGDNVLAAFLPEISDTKSMPRVSAFGWTTAYVAALVMLIIAGLAMKHLNMESPSEWRPFFVCAGVWYMLLMIPAAVVLKDPPGPGVPVHGIFREGVSRLARTIREAGRFKDLVRFLVAFFVAGIAVNAVVFFASRIASDYGYTGSRLVVFLLPVTLAGAIGAIAAGKIAGTIGNRSTVQLFIAIWLITVIGLLLMPTATPGSSPGFLLWFTACGMGIGLGGFGTSARATVGVFTPKSRSAEFFGLWGLTYKLAAVLGLVGFGALRAFVGPTLALVSLMVAFVAAAILMMRVNEASGIAATADGPSV